MGFGDIFRRKTKHDAPAAQDVNLKIAFTGLLIVLAEAVGALRGAFGGQAAPVVSVDLPSGASLQFFTL